MTATSGPRALAPAAAADRLSANAEAISALLAEISPEQATWKPHPSQWCMLEVINHLADEEVEDFRRRLELVLTSPDEPWPPIDPTEWPVSRAYLERRLDESVARFRKERDRSVAWLRGLGGADLELAHEHPSIGTLRGGDLLTAWLAHDLIHVRQITRLHHGWLVRNSASYRADYAGPF